MRVLFAGPSLSGEISTLKRKFPGLDIRPPAACGDILRAVRDGAKAIGLIDGYFGDLPSVWHKEILFALHNGVAVAGGASMGALRAAECAPFGMVGLGSIYEDYANYRLMDDEAVALVHGPSELGWLPLSVPWVDFEATIAAAHASGSISAGERKKLLLAGRFLHFSNRTYVAVVKDCAFGGRGERVLASLRENKVERKRADAHAVLTWLAQCTTNSRPSGWTFMATSHWDILHAEICDEAGLSSDTRAA